MLFTCIRFLACFTAYRLRSADLKDCLAKTKQCRLIFLDIA